MRVAVITLLLGLAVVPAFGQVAPPSQPGVPAPAVTPGAPGVGTRPSLAQRQERQGRARARFEAANTTHDGKLTLDQAKAANMVRIVRNFDAIDAQHRGYVTMQDIAAYRRAQREARRAAQPAK